jgi:hypothetical protein
LTDLSWQEIDAIGKDWGKYRADFYNTSFVDPDWGSDSDAEREAVEEEEEVKRLEEEQLKSFSQEDFAFDTSAPSGDNEHEVSIHPQCILVVQLLLFL